MTIPRGRVMVGLATSRIVGFGSGHGPESRLEDQKFLSQGAESTAIGLGHTDLESGSQIPPGRVSEGVPASASLKVVK
jgi:hypothetical protein